MRRLVSHIDLQKKLLDEEIQIQHKYSTLFVESQVNSDYIYCYDLLKPASAIVARSLDCGRVAVFRIIGKALGCAFVRGNGNTSISRPMFSVKYEYICLCNNLRNTQYAHNKTETKYCLCFAFTDSLFRCKSQ